MRIPFGPWAPDQPDFTPNICWEALNVWPYARRYDSVRPMARYSNAAMTENALGDAISVRDASGDRYDYAGGESALNMLDATFVSWSDVSKAGGYDVDANGRWEFVEFNGKVIATAWESAHTVKGRIQADTIGAGAFADLSGATGFQAKHIGVIGQFVIAGSIYDGSTHRPNRLKWCAIDDETDWTPAQSTQSGEVDLELGGEVQRIVQTSGNAGLVFCESAIYAMEYVGPPTIWNLQPIERTIGAFAPGGVCQYGDITLFLSSSGFRAMAGATPSVPIGDERVDRVAISGDVGHGTYLYTIDKTRPERISSAVDPIKGMAMWLTPSDDSPSINSPEYIYVFNISEKLWARHIVDSNRADVSSRARVLYVTQHKNDYPSLGVVTDDNYLAHFDGTGDKAASIYTSYTPLVRSGMAMLRGFRVGVAHSTNWSGTFNVVVKRDELDATGQTVAASRSGRTGRWRARAKGRSFGFQFEPTANWDSVDAVTSIEATPVGRD